MARNYLQGRYQVKNPGKYVGDRNNVIYRSSWELRLCRFLDMNENVIQWSVEETIVPYFYDVDQKMHRYFVDFWVKLRNTDGEIEEMLLEVKPMKQVEKPKIKKVTEKNQHQIFEWVKNQNKWNAASEYARKRGWTFKVLTEHELGISKKRK